MIHSLPSGDYARVRPLFAPLGLHQAVEAVLCGAVGGQVYVDDPDRPAAALLERGYRYYLAGSPQQEAFNSGLRRFFIETLYPQALAAQDRPLFILQFAPGWEACIPQILQGKDPIPDRRQYYALRALKHDWRALLPPGFSLRAVDRQLLSETQLGNLPALQEEMCSERDSVEEFLRCSFGYCLVHGNEIVSWSLSEFNNPRGCEIGIETVEPYRRQGLATIVATATAEHALRQGVPHVGWDCWASNIASQATARKVGFEQVQDELVYFAWYDEVANLAVNGNMRLREQDYAGAIPWFERALSSGRAQEWVYLRAACAYALAGLPDAALSTLRQGVQRGLSVEWIRGAAELQSLHESAEWRRLVG